MKRPHHIPQLGKLVRRLSTNLCTINEKLEELIQKTDEAIRRDVSAKRTFVLSLSVVVLLILIVIFGIVSVAHADPIKQRTWKSQESPYLKR